MSKVATFDVKKLGERNPNKKSPYGDFLLSTYIWKKSHEASALYSESKLALVLFGNMSSASTEDSAMRI
jgi:hypothetical protein